MMYNEHFGLRQAPFRITPDTSLFYTGGGRGDVLDALVYAITSGEGIVKVVGEVGTGKTMLCRMLEERLPDNVQIAYLANPSLRPDDILYAIAFELGLELPAGTTRLQVMHRLQETLLAVHARNRRVVALVEEAQRMPVDTLEEIRLLSNLETKNEKLLQIVLFGQPELDDNLALPGIRQLRERITHSFKLAPLARAEIQDYVAFRLREAGYRGRDAFSGDAYRVMSRASEGLTRRVNIIADKAMLAAFAENTHDVSARHVKVAIRDSEFDAATTRRARGASKPAIAAGIAAAAIVAGAAGFFVGQRDHGAPGVAGVTASPPRTASAPTARVATAAVSGDAAAADVDAAHRRPVATASGTAAAPPARAASGAESGDAAAVDVDAGHRRPVATASGIAATPSTAGAPGSPPVLASVPARTERQAQAAVPAVSDAAAPASAPTAARTLAAAAGSGAPGAAPDAPPAVRLAKASSGVFAQGAAADRAAAAQDYTLPALTPPRATAQAETMALASMPLPPPPEAMPAASAARPAASVAAVPTEQRTAEPLAAATAPRAAATEPEREPVAASSAAPAREPARAPSASPREAGANGSVPPAAADAGTSDLVERRLAHTRAWLERVNPAHFSIQLLATDARQRENLEAFLRWRRGAGDLDSLYVYETRINERPWFGVLYGEFDSYAAAREALRALPEELLRRAPFIRNVRDIGSLG
jgi:type II secretory pathway predicted ATPase ExeA